MTGRGRALISPSHGFRFLSYRERRRARRSRSRSSDEGKRKRIRSLSILSLKERDRKRVLAFPPLRTAPAFLEAMPRQGRRGSADHLGGGGGGAMTPTAVSGRDRSKTRAGGGGTADDDDEDAGFTDRATRRAEALAAQYGSPAPRRSQNFMTGESRNSGVWVSRLSPLFAHREGDNENTNGADADLEKKNPNLCFFPFSSSSSPSMNRPLPPPPPRAARLLARCPRKGRAQEGAPRQAAGAARREGLQGARHDAAGPGHRADEQPRRCRRGRCRRGCCG